MEWEALFTKALAAAMEKAGCGAAKKELCWEHIATDRTWGDRCGLVFFGAAPEINERAAKFFEKWAARHLRKLDVVGGYNRQESIGYAGPFYFSRYNNGARGWYPVRKDKELPVVGKGSYGAVCEEVKLGHATSFVYYPCGE